MMGKNNKTHTDDLVRSRSEWDARIALFKKLHNKNCPFALNIQNPQTLSDKFTFLTIYQNINQKLLQKSTAKQEIAKILQTDEYCIPTYQICNNIGEINWKNLIGKSFVIKPNNQTMSRGTFIQKKAFTEQDIEPFKAKINTDKYLKNATTIVIEKYIGAKNQKQDYMRDYKFWCFNGKPFCVWITDNRDPVTKKKQSNYYDLNFKKTDFQPELDAPLTGKINKPKNFNKMIEIAAKISKNIPLIRVDLYNVGGKIWFGELQCIYSFHCRFKNMEHNKILADKLDISIIKNKVEAIKNKESKYIIHDNWQVNDKMNRYTDNATSMVRSRGLEPPHLSA